MLLVGLFLILKYLGKEWINWLLSLYFALVGLHSVPHVTSLLFLAQFSLRGLTVPFQSLIGLAKFTLGRKRWNRFSRTSLKVESASRRESRPFLSRSRTKLTIHQRSCVSRVERPLSTSHLRGRFRPCSTFSILDRRNPFSSQTSLPYHLDTTPCQCSRSTPSGLGSSCSPACSSTTFGGCSEPRWYVNIRRSAGGTYP